ncbi:MAG TPA: cysteine desulfurase family protein [Chitinophagaceae bacterium]|nr:cysteine desulfurase family protein [Chitinophagaceae bacterium]
MASFKSGFLFNEIAQALDMKRIYFDNAATTPMDPDVLEAMMPYLTEKFGNPSSIYSYGRESRMAVEQARRTVARLLNAQPGEIFFTSGGTESTNAAITAAVRDLGCKRIITSPIEHHATLHSAAFLQETGQVKLCFVGIRSDGHIDLDNLENLLKESDEKTLVSLMHANNEIGNLLDIERVAFICRQHRAVFHCDTVQTLGHYALDLSKTSVDFINGAAHKFHGPKGIGILYIKNTLKVRPFIQGGSQERQMRAGTENLYGIVGFAKALENASAEMESQQVKINELRLYMANCLKAAFPGVIFNGDLYGHSLYTVLSVSLPRTEKTEMILMNLDIQGICASGGSACTSGANAGSHVIQVVNPRQDLITVRFSFSKYNTREEVEFTVSKMREMV